MESREAVSLAFVAAVQTVPPRQRAILVLRDVLGFRGAEVAEMPDTTVDAVASGLKRARSALANREQSTHPPLPNSPTERRVMDALVADLFTEIAFVRGTRRYRLVEARTNGEPAFGRYLRDPYADIARAHGLTVLTLDGDHISQITAFLDTGMLPRFGLPRILADNG